MDEARGMECRRCVRLKKQEIQPLALEALYEFA